MRHPHVPAYPPLDSKRKLLAVIALLMFALTLIPEPFAGAGLWPVVHGYWQMRH
jgi:hypothetical protein